MSEQITDEERADGWLNVVLAFIAAAGFGAWQESFGAGLWMWVILLAVFFWASSKRVRGTKP